MHKVGDKVWIIKQGHSFYRKAGIIDHFAGYLTHPYSVYLIDDYRKYDSFKDYELKPYIPISKPDYFSYLMYK